MEERKLKRCRYVRPHQKRRLVQFMSQHPQLVDCRVTQDFTHKDSQRLWLGLAKELNSMPGAKKSWQQWKRTWQDLKCRTKKEKRRNSFDADTLSKEEQAALGILSSETLQNGETDDHNDEDMVDEQNYEIYTESFILSDPEISEEKKNFTSQDKPESKTNMSNDCHFNCEQLLAQEQKKIQIKEDYLAFKKEYLKEKLEVMKQQVDALQSIAKVLSKK